PHQGTLGNRKLPGPFGATAITTVPGTNGQLLAPLGNALRFPAPCKLRQNHGDDQCTAVEKILDVCLHANDRETCNTRDQKIESYKRSPWVELTRDDTCCTEESCRKRRQQKC